MLCKVRDVICIITPFDCKQWTGAPNLHSSLSHCHLELCLKIGAPPSFLHFIRKATTKIWQKNYRPISLTSICSKIVEHIVYSSISRFLENNYPHTATAWLLYWTLLWNPVSTCHKHNINLNMQLWAEAWASVPTSYTIMHNNKKLSWCWQQARRV